MLKSLSTTCLSLMASAAITTTAFAQASGEYNFRYPKTPQGIDRYATAVTGFDDHSVYTMNGTPMTNSTRVIESMKLNPTGSYYAIAGGEGKKAYVKVYRNHSSITTPQLWGYNNKKLGTPTAFAFSPDGRNLLVATDAGKINVLSLKGKKFELTDTIPTAGPANTLVLSNNSYYAVAADGDKLRIYNLENNQLRTTLELDAKVTDAQFTDDSTELGVLTNDGVFRTYDTRTFLIKKSIDDLGEALSFCYTPDGKYIAVATGPFNITTLNLVDPDDRIYIEVPAGGVNDVLFITDTNKYTVLAHTADKSVRARRMESLTPFYGKLIASEADEMMNQWMKMLPDETMEEYQLRVNAESIAKQRQLFEDELATGFAAGLLSMSAITLGEYDARHELQEVNFNNMPSIYLPVPNDDKGAFTTAETLEFRDVRYGIMPNDRFEMIYANVYNSADGKIYTFDNVNRTPLAFMQDDEEEDPMTLEVIQQQQMEEMKLQEIKERVLEEAKTNNVISDHTNITVDSQLIPDFNANGDKILNYRVRFSYEVEPGFSASEDFGPGKYHVNESGAASSMLKIVEEALNGDFDQYVQEGKKLRINLSGTADSSPIRSKIAYDGSYGDIEDEPVTKDGQLTAITVTKATGITENEQLAFLRAAGVEDYLLKNLEKLQKMNPEFNYIISVAEGTGAEFRRITAEFTFIDVF